MSNFYGRRRRAFRRSTSSHYSAPRPGSISGTQQATRTVAQEIDFREMADGTLVEMIEDSKEPGRYRFATHKGGELAYTDQVEEGNRIFVPLPQNSAVCRYITFPKTASEFNSVDELLVGINRLLECTLDLELEQRMLMTAFVISTWFIEKLPVAPYLALVGPPSSGKTTALRVLNLLCRRSLLTADISSAAFYDVCDRLTPTLLIDETASLHNKHELLHLLRAGSTQGVVSLRKGTARKTYGARAVAWTELPDDPALNSRCIVVAMKSSAKTNLRSLMDPAVVDFAAATQSALLQFRLSQYQELTLPKVPEESELQPRTRDLYRALVLPVAQLEYMHKGLLALLKQQESIRETLPLYSVAVLDAAFTAIHEIGAGRGCRIGDLTALANAYLRKVGEPGHLSEKRVGSILTSFNLGTRSRTNVGYVQWFDRYAREQVHRLVANYRHSDAKISDNCAICQSVLKPSTSSGEEPGESGRPAPTPSRGEDRERRERETRGGGKKQKS